MNLRNSVLRWADKSERQGASPRRVSCCAEYEIRGAAIWACVGSNSPACTPGASALPLTLIKPVLRWISTWSWLVFAAHISMAQVPRANPGSTTTAYLDDLDQFVYANGIAMLKLRTSMIALPDGATLATTGTEVQLFENLNNRIQKLKRLVGDEDTYFFMDLPSSDSAPTVRIALREHERTPLQELRSLLQPTNLELRGGFLHACQAYTIEQATKQSIPSGDQQRALYRLAMESVADFPVQLVIVPPDYLWRTVRELSPDLPKSLGGGRSSLLTDGLRWGAVGFDPSSLNLQVKLQSNSPAAAQALAEHLPVLLNRLVSQFPATMQSEIKGALLNQINQLDIRAVDSQIEAAFAGAKDARQRLAMLSALANQLIIPIDMQSKIRRLQKISLVIHNYESAFKCFPPGRPSQAESERGKLSWRVYLLPFLGEEQLYQQFRLNEPWDSSHNKPLLAKIPDVFRSTPWEFLFANELPAGYTTWVAPVGNGTVFGQSEIVKFENITDGTSNTVWLVEVKPQHAVPWTAPQDYAFDPTNPVAGLNVSPNGKFVGGFADGSASQFQANMAAKNLLYLFQKSDGQIVER